jgi:hypothetical protein
MKITNIVIMILICMLCSVSVFAENITPLILIEKYRKNKNAFETQIIKSEEIVKRTTTFQGNEPEYDVYEYECKKVGSKLDFTLSKQREVEFDEAGKVLSSKQSDKKRFIWDGHEWSQVTYMPSQLSGAFFSSSDEQKDQVLASAYGGNYLDGFLWGDKQSIDVILKENSEITIRSEMENVNGTDCHVIDANTPYGKYTLWFDPEHGYNIAKAKSYKSGNDLYFDKPVNVKLNSQSGVRMINKPPGEIENVDFSLEITEFQKVGDIWVPVKSETQITTKYDDRTTIYTKHLKRTHVNLKPDFEAVKAFVPDIPEGTKISDIEDPQTSYIWQNNKKVQKID